LVTMKVPAINTIEMANWNTTRPLRSTRPRPLDAKRPFITDTGCNEEMKKAGYKPANTPIAAAKANNTGILTQLLSKLSSNCLPANWLKNGRVASIITTAQIRLNILSKTDSLRNWKTSCERSEPITLRTPTSLARSTDRAVAKFTKLMAAMSRMKAD